MHGDFSRNSFDPKHNFARVLMQQGRLIVDADWNEQSEMLLHYIRRLAIDIIGWHGGPDAKTNEGPFLCSYDKDAKKVKLNVLGKPFRYYVDGLMLESEKIVEQEVNVENPKSNDNKILVFLDVYETFIPSFSKQHELLDPALNGRDTCARSQIRHHVRALKVNYDIPKDIDRAEFLSAKCFKYDPNTTDANRLSLDPREASASGTMLAKTATQDNLQDCIPEPGQGFAGLENQLYRIEIQRGGNLLPNSVNLEAGEKPNEEILKAAATFKWSRDNGSVCYPGIIDGQTVQLLKNWPDSSKAIEVKQIVEVLIEGDELTDGKQSGMLYRVNSISESTVGFRLEFEPGPTLPANNMRVLVRRWDHKQSQNTPLHENAILLRESSTAQTTLEIPIEDGIFVQFQLPDKAIFFPGDYWLVPARVATGGIIWPKDEQGENPAFILPRFTQHHYAPIALIPDIGQVTVTDLRKSIKPIAE